MSFTSRFEEKNSNRNQFAEIEITGHGVVENESCFNGDVATTHPSVCLTKDDKNEMPPITAPSGERNGYTPFTT